MSPAKSAMRSTAMIVVTQSRYLLIPVKIDQREYQRKSNQRHQPAPQTIQLLLVGGLRKPLTKNHHQRDSTEYQQ
jgi:hypothetical protein